MEILLIVFSAPILIGISLISWYIFVAIIEFLRSFIRFIKSN